MPPQLICQDLGLIDFYEAWAYQKNILQKKLNPEKYKPEYLLFCEHPHVYTLGKYGSIDNLLINNKFLKKINASFYKIDRGGDITYHGPGQLIAYPIFNLKNLQISIKNFIFKLEEIIINTLTEFSINAYRIANIIGVWTGESSCIEKSKKICSIGIRIRHFVTMHGLALNVAPNLNYFNYINACGFNSIQITSMEKELNKQIKMNDVKNAMLIHFIKEFDLAIYDNHSI